MAAILPQSTADVHHKKAGRPVAISGRPVDSATLHDVSISAKKTGQPATKVNLQGVWSINITHTSAHQYTDTALRKYCSACATAQVSLFMPWSGFQKLNGTCENNSGTRGSPGGSGIDQPRIDPWCVFRAIQAEL